MTRTPANGIRPRESTITVRVTDEERKQITAARFANGDRNNSSFIRRVVTESIERRNDEAKSA